MEVRDIRERIERFRGSSVIDPEGRRIGYLEEIYYDRETHAPEWLGVATGFLGTRLAIAPVSGAAALHEGLQLGYARDRVMAAPGLCDDDLDEATENELTDHYGLARARRRAGVAGIPGVQRRT
jgi:hypothetical protein